MTLRIILIYSLELLDAMYNSYLVVFYYVNREVILKIKIKILFDIVFYLQNGRPSDRRRSKTNKQTI